MMFASQSKARIMQLRLQLQTTKNGNSSMVEYLQKMKTCADNLAVSAHPITDDDLVLYILRGLGQEYDVVVVLVTNRVELISLVGLHGLLLSQEYRLEQTSMEQGLGQGNLSSRQSNNTKNDNSIKKTTKVNNNQTYDGRFGRGRGRDRNANPSNQNQCQVWSFCPELLP